MARARTELVHCDNCGEDYAANYRRCPFCNAKPGQRLYDESAAGYDDDGGHKGGKRLAGGGSDGGDGTAARVAVYVLAAVVILAGIVFAFSVLLPKLLVPGPDVQPSPSLPVSSAPAETPTPTSEPSQPPAEESQDPYLEPLPVVDGMPVDDDPLSLDSPDLPAVEVDPVASQTPQATATPAATAAPTPTPGAAASPATQSGGLSLSSEDFTLSPRYPTYQLEISGVGRASATYSVKNEAVATVSSTGLVTAVGNGNTTITVTDQKGNTGTCIVRVSGLGASSGTDQAAPSQAPASEAPASEAPASETPASETPRPASGPHLNRADFSITAAYPDPYRLRVIDGEAASWSSNKEGVATVSGDGTVTAVGNGSAKITCTLTDGSTLTCDVHVSGK